jgi:hypothetical protein
VNVSRFTVGHCCRLAAKGIADRRQSLSPPAAACPAAPHAAAAPSRIRTGVSGFWRIGGPSAANLSAHRKTRNRAALAPSGVADVSAFKPEREDGPLPDCTGTAHPDPADDHGEPSLGSAEDPGGVARELGRHHEHVEMALARAGRVPVAGCTSDSLITSSRVGRSAIISLSRIVRDRHPESPSGPLPGSNRHSICAQDFSASSFSFPAGTRSMDSPHPHALFWFGLLNTNREARRSTL